MNSDEIDELDAGLSHDAGILESHGYDIESVESARRALRQLQADNQRLVAENEALKVDAKRLDLLGEHCTRALDSERYLPRQIYWGEGTHRNVREAIDAALERQNEAKEGTSAHLQQEQERDDG